MDKGEFEKLIRVVAPKISQEDMEYAFAKFDYNKDGNISFEEFYRILAYGMFYLYSQNLITKQ